MRLSYTGQNTIMTNGNSVAIWPYYSSQIANLEYRRKFIYCSHKARVSATCASILPLRQRRLGILVILVWTMIEDVVPRGKTKLAHLQTEMRINSWRLISFTHCCSAHFDAIKLRAEANHETVCSCNTEVWNGPSRLPYRYATRYIHPSPPPAPQKRLRHRGFSSTDSSVVLW